MTTSEKLQQLSKEHIISAIAEIDEKGIRSGRHSSTYDVIYGDKSYPPKLIISIACRYAFGEELDSESFSGGKGTEAFKVLEELGFEIKSKVDPVAELIANYKSYIRQSKMLDEIYKWELLSEYKGRPNTDALNFAAEYKEVKFGNLIYAIAGGVGNHICREKPEEFRQLFIQLFNEKTPLNDRISSFNKDSLELYRLIGETLGHHQDERTISAYLTYHDPSKYTFYKSSFYKSYCKLIGVKPAKKNEKYGHYLKLLNDFINDYVESDQELIELVKTFLGDHYDGSNHLLLAQDILYHSFDRRVEKTAINSNNNLGKFIKQFDSKKFAQFIAFTTEIIQKHHLHQGDERLTFNYYDDRMVISVGQRYCLGIFSKDNNRKFAVLSKDPISDKTEEFDGDNNKAYLNYLQEWNITDSQKQNIHEGISKELARTNRSGYRKHNKEDFEEYAYNLTLQLNSMKPLNTILYGPPGTGKTYKLKAEYFEKYVTRETSITSEQHFAEMVRPLTWWHVIGIALIEEGTSNVSAILNNRWVAQKAAFSESKNVRATLWGTLQMHTVESSETVSYAQRQSPLIFDKNEDKTWSIMESEAREQSPELYEILESVTNFNPNPDKEIKRYVFTTFHQSYSYEDFIEGIKPIMTDGDSGSSIGYEIENGIFKDLCLRAANDPENQYAIFIDEINRGNVSAIFGELITLIELDKRKNGANPMSATLPYSKKPFTVPSNVDIYGTMNTADRSVESLDTALRRRFTFVEMLPDPTLLPQEIEGVLLKTLLESINERIEVLVDRDHTIGHAFFINDKNLDDLRNTFANKVIPLLQEYFYGDYGKMEMVIGSDFFKVKDTSKVKFAVKSDDFDPEGKVYHIVNVADKSVMSDEVFVAALNTLIKGQD